MKRQTASLLLTALFAAPALAGGYEGPAPLPAAPAPAAEVTAPAAAPATPAPAAPLTVPVQAPASIAPAAAAASSASGTLVDPQGQPHGSVTLFQSGSSTLVTVQASGLTPGQHGMHLHEFGQCADKFDEAKGKNVVFGAAGGHFDPGASKNHDHPSVSNAQGHGGDLPMLTADAAGRATVSFISSRLSLSGETSVLNRALVIHADADDYATDPAGNSGDRVLCAVISGE